MSGDRTETGSQGSGSLPTDETANAPAVDPLDSTSDRADAPAAPLRRPPSADAVDPLEATWEVSAQMPNRDVADSAVHDPSAWIDTVKEQPKDIVEDPSGDVLEDAETVTALVEPDVPPTSAPSARQASSCPKCRFVGDSGARFCVRCGADMRVSARPDPVEWRTKTPALVRTPSPAPALLDLEQQGPASVGDCPKCQERVTNASVHCLSCGETLGEMMVLVAITPDGAEGDSLTPVVGEATLGRADESHLSFVDDPYLSPKHCKLLVTSAAVYVEDCDSLNGTFIRLKQRVSIGPGDTLVVGRQLLRLEAVGRSAHGESTTDDGTRLLGSPSPPGEFVLVQLSGSGRVQDRYHLPSGGGVIGCDSGEVRFPGDRYVSGRHATLSFDKGKATLLDMDSSNGTWLRIRRRTPLEAGDELYVGSQVFRVTFPKSS